MEESCQQRTSSRSKNATDRRDAGEEEVQRTQNQLTKAGTSEKEVNLKPSIRRPSRGKEFSQLLQKFSSQSEKSSSQKTDAKCLQQHCVLPSIQPKDREVSDDAKSNASRRTPERTQSVKLSHCVDKECKKEQKGVERSSSVRHYLIQKRFSPMHQTQTQSDAPSPELSVVLQRRQREVERQQLEGDMGMEESEEKYQARAKQARHSSGIEEIIADQEVASVLKARRKVTDLTEECQSSLSSAENKHSTHDSQVVQPVKGINEPDQCTKMGKLACKNKDSSRSSSNSRVDKAADDVINSLNEAKVQAEPGVTHKKKTVTKEAKEGLITDSSSQTITSSSKVREKSALFTIKHSENTTETSKISKKSSEEVVREVSSSSKMHRKSTAQKKMTESESSRTTGHSSVEKDQMMALIKSDESGAKKNMAGVAPTPSSVSKLSSDKKPPIASSFSSVRRADSLKHESPYKRNGSENPKGVVKRSPSLSKDRSESVIVDAQLSHIMKQRRKKMLEFSTEVEEKDVKIEKSIVQERQVSIDLKNGNVRKIEEEEGKTCSQKMETFIPADKSSSPASIILPQPLSKRKSSRFATQPVTRKELIKVLKTSHQDNLLGKASEKELLQRYNVIDQWNLLGKRASIALNQQELNCLKFSQPENQSGSLMIPGIVASTTAEAVSTRANSLNTAAETQSPKQQDRRRGDLHMICAQEEYANIPSDGSLSPIPSKEFTESTPVHQDLTFHEEKDRISPVPDTLLILPATDADYELTNSSFMTIADADFGGESTTDPVLQDECISETNESPADRCPILDASQMTKRSVPAKHKSETHQTAELKEMDTAETSPFVTPSKSSIAERLNQLKTRGEENWKRRLVKEKDTLILKANSEEKKVISDRLSKLEESAEKWKARVEETDAKQFTVANKMSKTLSVVNSESPLVAKIRASSKKDLTKLDDSLNIHSESYSTPIITKELLTVVPLPTEIIADPEAAKRNEKEKEKEQQAVKPSRMKNTAQDKAASVRVEVPSMVDEEFEQFFSIKEVKAGSDGLDVCFADFDNILTESNEILQSVKKIRPTRRKKATSRNPLKTVSQFVDIQTEYTQESSGIFDEIIHGKETPKLEQTSSFTRAALAGLASKENFNEVKLRKMEPSSLPASLALRQNPYSNLMLLHVKGRKNTQTRLVEPSGKSVNAGDCYVLVTKDKVINWVGEFSNVIEKAKSAEIASFIQQHRDLGYKGTGAVQTVDQKNDHLLPGRNFWDALQGDNEFQACGPEEEDELYETSIAKTNMVYRLTEGALHPYEECWGMTPRYAMLEKTEVLVFDFGSEFYVWQGTSVTPEQRRQSMTLAQKLWDKGYDYSQCAINPMAPLRSEEASGIAVKAPQRPDWTIFGKINQHMETILFREKFADWPDTSQLGSKTKKSNKYEFADVKAYDAKEMIKENDSPVTLLLEGAHVGRGKEWQEDMQGFIKQQEILTLDVKVWHVLEFESHPLAESSFGHFHSADTYVVRWKYMISNAGLKKTRSQATKQTATGRERYAYFFWQGQDSTINEQGASALMTVNLDEEKGPQVRVLQGKEPPCFLNLFNGAMVVYTGKREDAFSKTAKPWRMFCLRGDDAGEVSLFEIPVSLEHLRSRTSLILLNTRTGTCWVWHGCKSPQHHRHLIMTTAQLLKDKLPVELNMRKHIQIIITQVEEGKEKAEIWSALNSRDRSLYNSLLKEPGTYDYTPRLFYMTSISMVFEVKEVLNPARLPTVTTPFPFFQSDLYKVTQPALFMMDLGHSIYLWQGWWPVGDEDVENVHTGSAAARFNIDRRCAMETTLKYCEERKSRGKAPNAYIVYAGIEPLAFQNLFPIWEPDSTVQGFAMQEGKPAGYSEHVEDVYKKLTQTCYTLEELLERPFPDGVDPLRLESYLSDQDFEDLLAMDKETFYTLPTWKQTRLKQTHGLF